MIVFVEKTVPVEVKVRKRRDVSSLLDLMQRTMEQLVGRPIEDHSGIPLSWYPWSKSRKPPLR